MQIFVSGLRGFSGTCEANKNILLVMNLAAVSKPELCPPPTLTKGAYTIEGKKLRKFDNIVSFIIG